jgi:hypothetical protein
MAEPQAIRITLTPRGPHSVVVVARCSRCRLVAYRLLEEKTTNLAAIVGAEALAAQGCAHVDAVTLTGRKTLTRLA